MEFPIFQASPNGVMPALRVHVLDRVLPASLLDQLLAPVVVHGLFTDPRGTGLYYRPLCRNFQFCVAVRIPQIVGIELELLDHGHVVLLNQGAGAELGRSFVPTCDGRREQTINNLLVRLVDFVRRGCFAGV